MKKIYFLFALLTAAVTSAFAGPTAPTIGIPDNYLGTSFTAHWESNGSSQYLFSLYTLSDNLLRVSEDFSHVKQNDGKLDATNPNLPQGWNVEISENGTTDVVYYNGKDHILLDATGDKVATPLAVGGNLTKCIINANLVHADGVSEDNSSVFTVNVYDKEGDLISSGDTYALYFARRQDFDVAEAFGYMPANIGRIEFLISKDDINNVGDIAINSIEFEYNAPTFVLTDVPTTDNFYNVENVDAEAVYYYYVKTKEGNEVSPMSGIMYVDGFTPVKALEASNITATSFTANWEYLPKAKGYHLQPYRYDVAAESGIYTALNEKFSKSLGGTMQLPITSVLAPDALTDYPGWSGRNLIAAEGMLGANSGRFPVNMSYVHSPSLNLSRNNGVYTVRLKAHGTAGDVLSIYHVGYLEDGQLVMHKATFDANGDIDETWEMRDGASETVLSFEENKMKPFFLDEVEVTQNIQKGDVSVVTLDEINIQDARTTSYTFNDLMTDVRYGYTVTGWRTTEYGYEVTSATSDVFYATPTTSTAIHGTSTNGQPTVSISGNTVIVTLSHNAPIYVMGIDGCTKQIVAGKVGANTLTIDSGNMSIIKVGGRSYKVMGK